MVEIRVRVRVSDRVRVLKATNRRSEISYYGVSHLGINIGVRGTLNLKYFLILKLTLISTLTCSHKIHQPYCYSPLTWVKKLGLKS
jgi:hypothetical protein